MSKAITMTARRTSKADPDSWVESRDTRIEAVGPRVKPKRLTIDLDPERHLQLKIHCAKNDIQIAELMRLLIERHIESN